METQDPFNISYFSETLWIKQIVKAFLHILNHYENIFQQIQLDPSLLICLCHVFESSLKIFFQRKWGKVMSFSLLQIEWALRGVWLLSSISIVGFLFPYFKWISLRNREKCQGIKMICIQTPNWSKCEHVLNLSF